MKLPLIREQYPPKLMTRQQRGFHILRAVEFDVAPVCASKTLQFLW